MKSKEGNKEGKRKQGKGSGKTRGNCAKMERKVKNMVIFIFFLFLKIFTRVGKFFKAEGRGGFKADEDFTYNTPLDQIKVF